MTSPLGPWLERRRGKLLLTRSELANSVGCSAVYIKKIESGERKPSEQISRRLAEALQIPRYTHDSFVGTVVLGFAPEPPTNIAAPAGTFVDRTLERAELAMLLAEPRTQRMITLVGSGGLGKTRLAHEAAREALPSFDDGAFGVDCATISHATHLISAIVEALGFADTRRVSFEDLREYLEDKQVLLVLDSFEHIQPAAPIVASLLSSTRFLQLLITSRTRLGLQNELIMPVAPFALPASDDAASLEAIREADAVQLFLEQIRHVRRGYAPNDTQLRDIAALCVHLEGIPLAIELAASHMHARTPREILESLHSRLDLGSALVMEQPRHQTMRSTISWSYRLLGPRARELFACLGIFRGSFTLGDVIAICLPKIPQAVAVDTIEALVGNHLLTQRADSEEQSHYSMLDTVREFARELAQQRDDFGELQRRHAEYVAARATHIQVEAANLPRRRQLEHLALLHSDAIMALEWALRCGEPHTALRLCTAFWMYWNERNHVQDGRHWIDITLGMCDSQAEPLCATVILGASALAHSQADYDAALQHAFEARQIFETHSDRSGVADALERVGITQRARGRHDEAILMFERCLTIRQELGERRRCADVLRALGDAHYSILQFAEAENRFRESQQLYVEQQDQWGLALLLCHMGLCALVQRQFDRGAALLERSLVLLEAIGSDWDATAALSYLGFAELFRGRLAIATDLTRRCLFLRQQQGDKIGISYNLDAFAGIAAAEARSAAGERQTVLFERAVKLAGAASALRASVGAPFLLSAQPLYSEYRQAVRHALGDVRFELLTLEAQTTPLDQIVAYALYNHS